MGFISHCGVIVCVDRIGNGKNCDPVRQKKGFVSPIYKRGSRSSSNNYRPVVLMSCLGKVLEAVIRKKFMDHLTLILPENMFGFQAGKSTRDAIAAVLDKVNLLHSQGLKTCLLSMDASCAFDLVSHDLILGSLKRLGIGKRMLNWVESFLSDCSLSVKINNQLSSSWTPDIGAGHGTPIFSRSVQHIYTHSCSMVSNSSSLGRFCRRCMGWM